MRHRDLAIDDALRWLGWNRSLGLVSASIVVLLAVVSWDDFQGHPHWNKVIWVPFTRGSFHPLDVLANLLLCAPVGLFTALLFRRCLSVAFALTLGLSLLGEWTQVYSHGRFPSATDVTCNVVGALVAAYATRRKMSSADDHEASLNDVGGYGVD